MLSLLACGEEVETNAARVRLVHEVETTSADPLLGYAWDGGPEVPAPSPSSADVRLRLPYGEVGASSSTRYYLPFHEADEDGSGGAVLAFGGGARGVVRATGTAWTDGVFGSALEFPHERAELTIDPEEGPVLGSRWSLDFWVRPREIEPATLVRAPGTFELSVGRKGHCQVSLDTEPPVVLRSKAPLLERQWNHVGLTLEGPELRQIRLSVNGEHKGVRTEDVPTAPKLVVGGFAGAIDDLRVSAYPATSADFDERWEREVPPGEHELALRFESGTRSVRLWSGTLLRPVLAGDDWGCGELEHAAALEGTLRWTPGHWTRYRTEDAPLPRTTHPTVYVGDHRVFLFGGETRDSHVGGMVNTNDTWIFRTDTGEWRRSRSKEAPPPSCHQSAAYSPDHGVVLYAGGQFNEGDAHEVYDQTWLYFVEEDRWERRTPSGHSMPKFSDGVAVYLAGIRQFLVYGKARLFLYDPEKDRWTKCPRLRSVSSDGEPVTYTPGGSPMAGYDPESGLVVFYGGAIGGRLGNQWQDITALVDLETMTQTLLETEVAPPGRVRAGFAYDSRRKRFVLFGGVLDQMSQRKSDLWIFEPKKREWVALDASNSPSARGGFYHMAYDPELDRFVLLCGRHSPRVFLNEAWALHLDETAAGRASYVFDRRAFRGANHWFAEWEEPQGARVEFRFRASADGIEWGPWSSSVEEAASAQAPLVQVEIRLTAGGLSAAPSVLRMGFAGEATVPTDSDPTARHITSPVSPLAE